MKSLKYLHLNLEPYACECDHDSHPHDDFVDSEFHQLAIREKSLSYLKMIIIDRK